jgi:hypothetical protein
MCQMEMGNISMHFEYVWSTKVTGDKKSNTWKYTIVDEMNLNKSYIWFLQS